MKGFTFHFRECILERTLAKIEDDLKGSDRWWGPGGGTARWQQCHTRQIQRGLLAHWITKEVTLCYSWRLLEGTFVMFGAGRRFGGDGWGLEWILMGLKTEYGPGEKKCWVIIVTLLIVSQGSFSLYEIFGNIWKQFGLSQLGSVWVCLCACVHVHACYWDSPPWQRITQPKMSMVSRLRNLDICMEMCRYSFECEGKISAEGAGCFSYCKYTHPLNIKCIKVYADTLWELKYF